MNVRVRYVVFGNFASSMNFEVDSIDEKELHKLVYQKLLEDSDVLDWPLTEKDVEISKIIIPV